MQTHVLKPIPRRQALGFGSAAGASMSGVALAGPEEVGANRRDHRRCGRRRYVDHAGSAGNRRKRQCREGGVRHRQPNDGGKPCGAFTFWQTVILSQMWLPSFSPAMGACYAFACVCRRRRMFTSSPPSVSTAPRRPSRSPSGQRADKERDNGESKPRVKVPKTAEVDEVIEIKTLISARCIAAALSMATAIWCRVRSSTASAPLSTESK